MKKLIISLLLMGLVMPMAQAGIVCDDESGLCWYEANRDITLYPILCHKVKSGETFWSIAKQYYGNGRLGLKLYDHFVESGQGWIYENGEHRHKEWDDTIRPIRPEELQIGTLLFIPKLKAAAK